jgi:GNAT superfamily N-acetyltransferase
MVDFHEVNLEDRRQVNRFLEFPFKVYKNTAQWVPPIESDARRMLDRRQNPFFLHSDASFWVALDSSGRVIGRIAALDHRNYNLYNKEKSAFFYLFECEERQEVAKRLFEVAIEWAQKRGLDKMIGPKGFSVFDGLGLLVKGFEHRPAFGLPYNPPYYPALIEGVGFQTEGELVSGYLNRFMEFPEKIHRAARLIQERRGLTVAQFRSRKDLRSFAPKLKELYNRALVDTGGNSPLTDEEVKTLADQMIWFADPRLLKIIYKDDQPIGFLLAYPDISAAVQKVKGRLFPFGWLYLLIELKRTQWININGAGILDRYRGSGGTALLFSEMHKSVIAGRYIHADLVQIGVENERMQRELEGLGIDFYKKHRIYCLSI